jgi:hypothetical protein
VVANRSLAKRGRLAPSVIHNKDKRKHTFDLRIETKQPLLLPGTTGELGAHPDVRSRYLYQVDGKVHAYLVAS